MENVLYSTKRSESIPFIEIVLPYAEYFLNVIGISLSDTVKDKLHAKLLEELSIASEVTVQYELDGFTTFGNSNFNAFVEKMGISLVSEYPVLDEILKRKTDNFTKHISKIVNRFQKDRKSITILYPNFRTRFISENLLPLS